MVEDLRLIAIVLGTRLLEAIQFAIVDHRHAFCGCCIDLELPWSLLLVPRPF